MPIAARQLLAAGVTSARDVAAPLEAAVHVRGRVRERIIDGPDLYVSGPALGKLAPAGTGAWHWEVTGAPDARAKVQRLANAGVDYVLLADLELWTAEEIEAVVSEARIRGLPVHALAERPADVVRGAAAQFDGFLGTCMGEGPFPAEVMQAVTGRLTQAGARPIAWTPAISARSISSRCSRTTSRSTTRARSNSCRSSSPRTSRDRSRACLRSTRRDCARSCASSTTRR